MWRSVHSADTEALRPGALGGYALIAATVSLVSAISGATVVLYVGVTLPPAGHGPVQAVGRAAPQAPAQAVAAGNARALVALSPQPAAQPRSMVTVGSASDRVAPRAPATLLASASPPEHELTFAWGYAQRHPEAQVGQRQARLIPAAGRTTPRSAQRDSNGEARLGGEERRSAAARSNTLARASRIFAQFEDPHQALAYAEPTGARSRFEPASERNIRRTPERGAVRRSHIEDATRHDIDTRWVQDRGLKPPRKTKRVE